MPNMNSQITSRNLTMLEDKTEKRQRCRDKCMVYSNRLFTIVFYSCCSNNLENLAWCWLTKFKLIIRYILSSLNNSKHILRTNLRNIFWIWKIKIKTLILLANLSTNKKQIHLKTWLYSLQYGKTLYFKIVLNSSFEKTKWNF